MAYIVYITEECWKEAKIHSVQSEMEKLKKSIEGKQTLSGFDDFPPPYWVKKQFGRKQGRLITKVVPSQYDGEEHTVIVFLGFLIKGDNGYLRFERAPESVGEILFKNRYNDNGISKYLEERLKKDPPKKKELPEPSYLHFLNLSEVPSGLFDQKEQMVYESANWISSISETNAPWFKRLDNIRSRISNLLDIKGVLPLAALTDDRDGIKICYRYLEEGDLFLIDIKPSDMDFSSHREHSDPSKESNFRKGYPAYILADPDIWRSIEMDAQNNYILSPEEKSVLSHAVKDRKFPLFINGRAGSGKTTILQYIFSEYCANAFLMDENITPPVYFTYSDALKKKAFKFVEGIFANNAKFQDLPQDKLRRLSDNSEKTLESCFWEWRSYLKSLITEPAKKKHFENSAKHIKYGIFKEKWQERWGKHRDVCNNYGADMSWHVIRTYIKGLNPDAYTDTEDYILIEKKLRTIDEETYKKVYENIWPWYKKLCETECYWDDQDLARYALEENLAKPKFPAIFCDEAQDFTRIEIELILRLSYFSDKQVPREYISGIPFVFSGDELQTLNPTGFRWDALKAWFSEKFLSILNEGRGQTIQDEQFKTLASNYRSPQAITNFCNIFQLFRATHFHISGIVPQKAWDDDPTPRVFYYEADNPIFWDHIKKINALFIIPCDEGAEENWKNNDDKLHGIKKQGRDVSVLSSAQAKGQEFPWVVLYKFGAESPPYNYTEVDQNLSDSLRMQMEYYINKAYVAASRATQNLIILDTKKDSLWRLFDKNNKDIPTLITLATTNDSNRWNQDKHLFYFDEGNSDNLDPGKKLNPQETAEKLKEIGLSRPDSWTLKQAAIAYRNIGDESVAKECEAYALFLEKKFREAGEAFEACAKPDYALEAYWLSQNIGEIYLKICTIAEKTPRFQNHIIYLFAVALTQPQGSWEFQRALDAFARHDIAQQIFQSDITLHRETLEKAIEQLFIRIEELGTHNVLNPKLIDDIYEKIKKNDFAVKCSALGLFAYRLGNPQLALSIWEEEPEENLKKYHEAYYRAKAELATYPESIGYYYNVKDWHAIITNYENNQDIPIESGFLLKVVEAYYATENKVKAISFSNRFTAEKDLSDFKFLFKNDPLLYEQFRYQEMRTICEAENWDAIANKLKEMANGNKESVQIFTQFLARVDLSGLPDTPSKNDGKSKLTRRDISDFLVAKVLPYTNELPAKYVLEVGSAFEKAYNHSHALEYYEKAMAYFDKNSAVVTELKKRWIVCKERHASHTGDHRRKQEAARARASLGLSQAEKLPEFPLISNFEELIKELAAPPSNIKLSQSKKNVNEFKLGGFSGKYNPKNCRLNLTHDASLSSVSINNGEFQSFDFKIKTLNDTRGKHFQIEGTTLMYRISSELLILWDESRKEEYTFDLNK